MRLRTVAARLRVVALGVVAACVGASAAADPIDEALAAAVSEQRAFILCSATLPATHELMVRSWDEQVAEAAEALRVAGQPRSRIQRFQADAAAAMAIDAATPFGVVVSRCAFDADWERRMQLFDYERLTVRIDRALQDAAAPKAAPKPEGACLLLGSDPEAPPLYALAAGAEDAPLPPEIGGAVAAIRFAKRGCLLTLFPMEDGANPISVSGGRSAIPLDDPPAFARADCTCFSLQ